MVDKAKLAKLLRILAQIVDSSSDDELAALERYSVSKLMTPSSTSKSGKNKSTESSKNLDSTNISAIIESMRHLPSRDAGVSLLERQKLNKRTLEQIARRLDLPVMREDTAGRLIQKIVEATLGPRLNSEAIRGDAGAR